jgi:hypothetical protein
MPPQWNELWEMLPNKTQRGEGWDPPLPLILAAWAFTTPEEKQARLELHLGWASDHNVLEQVARFVKSIPENAWNHRGEWPS